MKAFMITLHILYLSPIVTKWRQNLDKEHNVGKGALTYKTERNLFFHVTFHVTQIAKTAMEMYE